MAYNKLNRLLGLVLVSFVIQFQKSAGQEFECRDDPPPGPDDTPARSCLEQKLLGKCCADWMKGYCKESCGFCSCVDSTVVFKSSEEDLVVKKEAHVECSKDCDDVAPSDEFTCQQQAFYGKCEAQWMIDDGFCAASCGRCKLCDDDTTTTTTNEPISTPISEDCDDIPPGDDLTCEEQKQYDKCTRSWMIEGNYCRKSCGRCSGATKALTASDVIENKEDVVLEIGEQVMTERKTAEKQVKEEAVEEQESGVLAEKQDSEEIEDEDAKRAKVRQDMEKLLAANNEMEYMEALGFELSRNVIMDALQSDAPTLQNNNKDSQANVQPVQSPVIEAEDSTSIDIIQADAIQESPTQETENEKPRKRKNQKKNNKFDFQMQAPVVEEKQKLEDYVEDSVSAAVSAPILTVFGAGALKDLAAEVPEIADMFGSSAAGLDAGNEVDESAAVVDNPINGEEKESKQGNKKQNQSSDASNNVLQPTKQTNTSTTEESPKPQKSGSTKNSKCKSTILEEVSLHPDLSLLSSILQELDLSGILEGNGSPVTLLAPDNRSLNTLLETAGVNLSTALNDNSPVLNSLKHLILYHLLDMPYDGDTMQDIAIANTKLGSDFPIFVEGSGREKVVFEAMHSVGEIRVKDAVEACGSVVHIIEGVLMPFQKFDDIPNHNVDVDPFLSPPPPPPSPTPSPIPVPSPEPIPSPACHYATAFEILREHDEVSMFVDFMKTFGMLNRLDLSNEPTTLFVPVNDAVMAAASQLGTDEENLLNDFLASGNTQLVSNILNYHIVSGERVGAADLDEDKPLETVQGGMLFPEESGKSASASIQGVGSTARIVQANVDGGACQVSVHFIDVMLLPFAAGSATLNSTFNSMMACQDELLPGVPSCDDVVRAGLCQDSGVQEGGYCMKACGHCTTAEELKMADHIVLESAYNGASTPSQPKLQDEEECRNIKELLVDNWELSIFRSLIDDNVENMFSSISRPITIFAPSDSAFRELLENPVGEALDDSVANVSKLLSYHTVDGLFSAKDLKEGDILSTLSKDESSKEKMTLTIRQTMDDNIMVQGAGSQAKMTSGDIVFCQGVIHIIDKVLLPSAYATN